LKGMRSARSQFLLIALCALVSPIASAERFTPAALCAINSNNSYESITPPVALSGDYPSGSTQTITINVGDTKQPGGNQANNDTEHVAIFLDTTNNGTPELLMSNATCIYNRGATPPGCASTQTVTMPTVTEDTTFRGRIVLKWNQQPATACGNNGFGDSEDYLITADVQETITITDVSAPEDNGPITVTAVLSHNVRDASGFAAFTVDYVINDGSATIADNDYTGTTGTLTFSGVAGEAQTFTINPVADSDVEGDETVNISLTNLSNTTHGIDITDTAIATIIEDSTEVALEIVKSVNDNSPNVGDTLTFSLQVNNTGPNAAIDASVQDILPTGFSSITPVSVPTGTSFSVSGNTIDWTGIDIATGGSVTATFSAIVLPP